MSPTDLTPQALQDGENSAAWVVDWLSCTTPAVSFSSPYRLGQADYMCDLMMMLLLGTRFPGQYDCNTQSSFHDCLAMILAVDQGFG